MPGRKDGGSYLIFDRMFFLMKSESFRMNIYLDKYGINRSTFFRDLNHLKNFYDIDFEFDYTTRRYKRIHYE